MSGNPYFETAATWNEAEALLTFRPLRPGHTEGFELQSLRVHMRDHKRRELPAGERSLEAHYGAFVLSQARKGREEARRLALDVQYGRASRATRIAGHEARVYELGPEPARPARPRRAQSGGRGLARRRAVLPDRERRAPVGRARQDCGVSLLNRHGVPAHAPAPRCGRACLRRAPPTAVFRPAPPAPPPRAPPA